ncbi:MAG: aminotransferase class I/II-fold pyridoxal phosphate-dependent enzyme [Lentisphaerae bacterium]|nr:aminotransferase class I/II-fold pyridoxal phosphate-dependent enzyme [Lentisphaerota bacterium]
MIPRFAPTVGWGETLAFLADALRARGPAGPATAEFERAFASHLGCDRAVFVPSGRMALWLVLRALGYPPGSEVVLPAFTFFAMPAVVRLAGLTPVYADVDPETYELSPASVAAVLTERTRAVVPTHLFGRTCDMAALEALCAPRGIDLIEDCAQCLGARIGGRAAGTLGRAACFTFGVTKNFTTFGGGMVVCRDRDAHEAVAAAVRGFRAPARQRLAKEALGALAMRAATRRALFSAVLGPIVRATGREGPDLVQRAFEEAPVPLTAAGLDAVRVHPAEAQARAGLRQLRSLEAKNAARRDRGRGLWRRLQEAGCGGLPSPAAEGGDHIYVSFAVTRPDRHRFAHRLRGMGVDSAAGYMSNCASLPGLGGDAASCPSAARVEDRILHLPLYPELTDRDLDRIADAVRRADQAGSG